jgi:hypothetical protein
MFPPEIADQQPQRCAAGVSGLQLFPNTNNGLFNLGKQCFEWWRA